METETETAQGGAMTDTEIHKGLAGVVVDTTEISSVNQQTNSLLYRGYPVQELAAKCSFEQVAYLIWHGELPSDDELGAFEAVERGQRELRPEVQALIEQTPVSGHPMDVLRTAVSLLGALETRFPDEQSDYEKAVRLFAQLPAIVAYDQRHRHGMDPIPPREDLDYASNFLWMTFGELPDPVVVDAFRQSLVLYAEHSFNASTFTARVVASTLSDLHSAVVAAIGALKGPLHGGANEAVMATFAEIGSASNVQAWLDDALASKKKIMGFGHRVYKNGDSRVPTMEAALKRVVEHYNRPDVLELYTALEEAMGARKNIKPNLDYPSGPAYHLMGFDTPTFTPIFAAARVTGWTAHFIEQQAHNSLIRPLSKYTGPEQRAV
jgi:2-methylcitrate synthase/citrate synthase II